MTCFNIGDLTYVKQLGIGGFGEVSLYTNGKTQYAIKSISKQVNEKMIKREVYAGQILKHKNIATFKSYNADDRKHYLTYEFLQGMNLYHYFSENKFQALNERVAKKIFRKLAEAVAYTHSKGIVHLDLKLDNVMINPKNMSVKLIDFGLCNIVTEENEGRFNYRVGSQEYWAPETIPEKFPTYSGHKVDVWCLGIMLYCILNASFPYDPVKREKHVKENGIHPGFIFVEAISESAQSLIKQMLTVDPDERITMEQVLNHPWLKKSKFPKFW